MAVRKVKKFCMPEYVFTNHLHRPGTPRLPHAILLGMGQST